MPIIGPRGNKPPASGTREAAPGRDRNGERWPDDPASVGPQDRQHHAPQRRAPEPEQGSQEPWLGSGDVLPDWPDARAQPHQQQPGPGRPQTAPQSAPDDHAWEWSGGFGALPPHPRAPTEPQRPVPVEPKRPVRRRKRLSRLQEALRRASQYDAEWPEDAGFGRVPRDPAGMPRPASGRSPQAAPGQPHGASLRSGDPEAPPQRRPDARRPSQPPPAQAQRLRQAARFDNPAPWPDDLGAHPRHDIPEAAQTPLPAQPQRPSAPGPQQWPPQPAVPDNAAAWSDDFSMAPSREEATRRPPQKPEVLRRVAPPPQQDDPRPAPLPHDDVFGWFDLGAPPSRDEAARREGPEATAQPAATVAPSPVQPSGHPGKPQPASREAPLNAREKQPARRPAGEGIRPQPDTDSEVRSEAAGTTAKAPDAYHPMAVAAASAAILQAAPENAATQSAPSRHGPQWPGPDHNAWQWADDGFDQPQPGHGPAAGHRQDGAPHPHATPSQQQGPAQRAPHPSPQDEWQWTDGLMANRRQASAPQPAPAGPQAPQRPPQAQAPRQHRQDGQHPPEPPQSGLRRMHGSAPGPRGRDSAPRQAPKAPPSRSRELVVRQRQPFTPRSSRSRSLARRPGDRLDPQNVFEEALESVKKAVYAAGLFSLIANMLMLGGPLFMLQVYDRVLPSGSIRTLIMLSLLLVVLYAAHGLLDMLRGQTLNRIAGRIDNQLGPATLEALPNHRLATGRGVADEPLRDLAALRQFISGSGPAAFFDLPWAPLFLLVIALMHWTLGVVMLVGMLGMVGIAVWNEIATKSLILEAKTAAERASRLAIESGRNLEACVSMGMMDPIVTRWQMAQQKADAANRQAGHRAAAFTSAAKTFRMFMQSVLLAIGALLVIKQQISSGTMIAVALIGGQALGPIGSAVSHWRSLVNARDAFARLRTFHKRYPAEPRRFSLPAPKGRVEARSIQVTPPGSQLPALRDVSFSLEAGEALGIIGASAAGKSTLARVLVGLWPPERGFVLLDGVDMRMWNRDELGPKIGYLPQTIDMFDGTIAQNISRFYPHATPDRIFRAAERVGAHQMIVDLPDGYNFRVGENGSRLSAGQRQRIGLARAVYGDPALVVLDEPNANLDGIGEAALHRTLLTLKAARTTVILVTHRTSALDAVDHILVLEKGQMRAFGEKAKVLQALTRTSSQHGKAAAATPLTALPRNEAEQGA